MAGKQQVPDANLRRGPAAGTPERTLTSDLPLRRRPLYTTELLGHMRLSEYESRLIVAEFSQPVKVK